MVSSQMPPIKDVFDWRQPGPLNLCASGLTGTSENIVKGMQRLLTLMTPCWREPVPKTAEKAEYRAKHQPRLKWQTCGLPSGKEHIHKKQTEGVLTSEPW